MKKFTVLIPLILSLFFVNPAYTGDLCRVLKTGQTTSYATGDDGDLELGIARDYTVLDAGQYSGTSNIVINSKTHALSNNCVQDNRTGLMWARRVPDADIGPATDGKLFWEQWTLASESCTFATAGDTITAAAGTPFDVNALCVGRKITITGTVNNNGVVTVSAIANNVITVSENLTDEGPVNTTFATLDDLIWDALNQANTNSLGGYTDWRIPNVFELEDIRNMGNFAPCIDVTTFPSTPSSHTWTGTADSNSPSVWVYIVYFGSGSVYNRVKKTSKNYVRFVRGDSSSYGIKLYITSSSGTYNDLTIDATGDDDEYGIVCIGDSNTFTDCDVEGGSNLVDGDTNSFNRCMFD